MLTKPKSLQAGDKVALIRLSWGGAEAFPIRYEIGKRLTAYDKLIQKVISENKPWDDLLKGKSYTAYTNSSFFSSDELAAEASQAGAELALAHLRLQFDAEKARLDLDAAERQFAMAKERRELTADNLRLAEKAFSLGESDLTTLLRVRAGAFEAEAFLNRQQVARAAAQSRLEQALGVLP